MPRLLFIVCAAVAIIGTGCAGCPRECNRDLSDGQTAATQQNPKAHGIVYVSEHGKFMTAYFDMLAGTVEIELPDGRNMMLPRTISASGARYSNGRETFWEHHGEGSFLIGNKLIFTGTATIGQKAAGDRE